MTRTETRLAIKALPYMSAECVDGEWRVSITLTAIVSAFPDQSLAWAQREAGVGAYFTTDAEDALGTARAMSDRWARMYAPRLQANDA